LAGPVPGEGAEPPGSDSGSSSTLAPDLPWPPDQRVTLLDSGAVERTLVRMAREIVERNEGVDNLVVMGIHRRGVELAERIRATLEAEEGREIPFGTLDITLYRDDLETVGPRPLIGESSLPWRGWTAARWWWWTTSSSPAAPPGPP
jgi:hypothetical protein